MRSGDKRVDAAPAGELQRHNEWSHSAGVCLLCMSDPVKGGVRTRHRAGHTGRAAEQMTPGAGDR